jgi:uncharacterized sporulation protein YeaH/YhbH (DUF444 family)
MSDQRPPPEDHPPSRISAEVSWYELFSRGARDWLRHNQKIREAVRDHVRKFITESDVITGAPGRTVMVPIRLLEHARFRLRDADSMYGVGQGEGEPGEVLRESQPRSGADRGHGGTGEGEVSFVVELNVDDVLDWLWHEMKLPELKPKDSPAMEDATLVREGWDHRGVRSRLDRRRTVKEAVKRRAIQAAPVPFTDDDLRYRQLARRRRPATSAAVIFALDVSASMGEAERRLAKTFFFFALQGIRRQYPKVECVFIGHTVNAWEFSEAEFFLTSGTGGTMASSAFKLGADLLQNRYDPSRYNCYFFYASDGENAADDRGDATEALRRLATVTSYTGYVEISPAGARTETEMGSTLAEVRRDHPAMGHATVTSQDDVWAALREFFLQQTSEAEAA